MLMRWPKHCSRACGAHLQVVGFIKDQDSTLPGELLDRGPRLGIHQIIVGHEHQLRIACQLSRQVERAWPMHLCAFQSAVDNCADCSTDCMLDSKV